MSHDGVARPGSRNEPRSDLDVLYSLKHGKLQKGRTVTPELVGVGAGLHVMLAQQSDEKVLAASVSL
ncbi:hypothetical protein GCM10008949_49230 [Deinococcus humi]|nr:hypothetical protein GCM10008949_49230 [Deinococcus humi]